jgi:endonuclease YncB( thermonuclease family)
MLGGGFDMFGWRRKNDGFEWHKYVRTTIKLRREDRRARLLDAKEVAADGLRYAGRVGVSAGSSGAVMAWNGLVSGARIAIGSAITGVHAMARTAERVIAPAGRKFGELLAARIDRLRRAARGWPVLAGLSDRQLRLFGYGALAAVVLGGGYLATRSGPATLAGFRLFAPQIVEGKAAAVGGDSVRINGTTIRLSGIEAPDADQKCLGANKKRWSCGEAAQGALQRLVKSKTVRCELSGTDPSGRPLGTCQTVNVANSQDLAGALVRDGAVFSGGGLFASYGSLEAEAKAKKVGLWKGEAERPADYRAKLWDAAAKAAPDGCPIKGQVAGDSKTYVLPWSPDYGGVRIRPARGERWFCSEAEAQAAGWKVAGR